MNEPVIPLFPLKTVLYPEGTLPLRVFEPRYLDMVSHCLRTETEFGVLAIYGGSETSEATTYRVGTTAQIIDWGQGADGLLRIVASGVRRFQLTSVGTRDDGLYTGSIESWLSEDTVPVPEERAGAVALLKRLIASTHRETGELRYDDASWVGFRLAELLPLKISERQYCLELTDALERIEAVQPAVSKLGG